MRRNRTRAEREATAVRRDADRQRNVVTHGIDQVSNRVEDAIQMGVATGQRVVSVAQGQIA